MERKIGEIFEYNGEWYQCVEAPINEHSCNGCQGCKGVGGPRIFGGECDGNARKDRKFVIFKKLEKVGKPYMLEDKKFQKYRVYKTPYIYHKIDYSWQSFADPYYVSLEIKPTKENMEEKKLNLKPFDIQKAREGKPVCTRDGRKARIICFDRKDCKRIVALVQVNNENEVLYDYYNNGGVFHSDSDNDLMMLPEKKEGWVNVYKRNNSYSTGGIYSSKEEAEKQKNIDCIVTIKLEWEE